MATRERLTNASTTGVIQEPHASSTSILIYPVDANEVKSGSNLLNNPVQSLCMLRIVGCSFVAVEDVTLVSGLVATS